MKKIIITICAVFFTFFGYAQQYSQYTNFTYNKLWLNPAYAGSRETPNFTLLYRNQWLGFDGAPESQLLSFDMPIANNKIGLGVALSHHKIGLFNDYYLATAYSYKIDFQEGVSLRLGLQGSVRSLNIDLNSNAVITDPFDPGNAPTDPSKGSEDENSFKANFGAGAYLLVDEIYFGISVPQLYSGTLGINETGTLTAEEKPHFYGMLGGKFDLNENIAIKPSLLTKYVQNAPFDFDVNMSVVFSNKVIPGISYRHGDGGPESLDLTFFFQATDALGIGGAYDFILSDLSSHTNGSFEVLLRYDVVKKDDKEMANPRFFF